MLLSGTVWFKVSGVISCLDSGIMGLNLIQGVMNVCLFLCLCCTSRWPADGACFFIKYRWLPTRWHTRSHFIILWFIYDFYYTATHHEQIHNSVLVKYIQRIWNIFFLKFRVPILNWQVTKSVIVTIVNAESVRLVTDCFPINWNFLMIFYRS
jgi:hypothetical protein